MRVFTLVVLKSICNRIVCVCHLIIEEFTYLLIIACAVSVIVTQIVVSTLALGSSTARPR